MKCPSCKEGTLAQKEIEPGLPARCCSSCSGIWIARAHYDAWAANQVATPTSPDEPAELQVNDIPKAKVCPQCGHLLMKYRIGRPLSFQIDNCTTCGGFWFDLNEWAALKAHHLHGRLVHVLSPTWQRDALRGEVQGKIEETYAQRLGKEAFAKAKEVKTWLEKHPNRASILAYLTHGEG